MALIIFFCIFVFKNIKNNISLFLITKSKHNMGTFIFIAIAVFIIAVIISVIFKNSKEKDFEKQFPEDVIKSKKTYKGSLTLYTDQTEEKTILRYFLSGKINTLPGFISNNELIVGKTVILFDTIRKKLAIIKNIEKAEGVRTIPFSDVISLQPVQISNTKVISRGKVLPISIAEYSWTGGKTKTLKKIEHVYIEIKYKVQDCEMAYKLTYHEGPSNGDSKDYDKIIRATNIDINKINSIIAHHLN